ncbi:MAG: trigger factor [candidate division Zixibacteria bacterium]|nr:trigger factor [candidate division Zixibacteria bacterium]
MKVELSHKEGLLRELQVEVPAERVQTEMNKMFEEKKRSVTLKGFRKGMAPIAMVKQLYAEEVRLDAIDELIQATYPEAVREKTLRVATKPTVTDLKMRDDGGFMYVAQVEVMPEVQKISYEGLEVSYVDLTVEDKEVDEVIEHYRRRLSELRTVDRPASTSDVVVADLRKIADPKLAVEQDFFANSEIDLGYRLTVEQFKEALPGVKPGDVKQVEVVYPEDYSDPKFAGAQLTWQVQVKAIKERILPDLDDAFAKRTGMGETALELKLKVRENIHGQKEETQQRYQRRQVMHFVCEKNPIPIPTGMVNEYLDAVVEDFKKQGGEFDEPAVRENYRPVGVESMRWDLIWRTLASDEKIEVLPADTDNWIRSYAERHGVTTEEASLALAKSGRAEQLRDSLMEEKVIDFLVNMAKKVPLKKDK